MRRHDERGASLIMVLALVAFLAIMLPAILGLALTGSRVTMPVKGDRRAQYVADSALDAAINQGRQDWVGRPGQDCPSQTLNLESLEAEVTCQSVTRWCDLDRSITYAAVVTDPSSDDVVARANAEVVFRYVIGSTEPTVEVRKWDVDAPAPLVTSTLPACPVNGAPTTTSTAPTSTTSTSTTSTTTPATTTSSTSVPSGIILASLGPLTAQNVQSEWSAQGLVTVRDASGHPLAGATIRVEVYSRTNNQAAFPALPQATIDGLVTGAAGTVPVSSTRHSSNNGNSGVRELRFQIVEVSHPSGTWPGASSGVIPPDGELIRTVCRPGATCP